MLTSAKIDIFNRPRTLHAQHKTREKKFLKFKGQKTRQPSLGGENKSLLTTHTTWTKNI